MIGHALFPARPTPTPNPNPNLVLDVPATTTASAIAAGWLLRSPSTGRVEVPFSARFHFARSGRNPDGMLVEGLRTGWSSRMSGPSDPSDPSDPAKPSGPPAFTHLPVMVEEVTSLMMPVPPGVLLDATLGGAGHARAILDAAPQLSLVGLDQDPDAVAASRKALEPYGDRARVEQARFDAAPEVLGRLGVDHLSAALFDLGVSSPQLDRAERGFSYRQPAPLDMRMDPGRPFSAHDLVNTWGVGELTRLLRDNGEGRFAHRIARAIVAARPVESTIELAEVVRDAIPAATRRTGGHPARRAFQAIRIAVNQELDILPDAVDAVIDLLAPGGRCVVLAYHSGEDRIIKARFVAAATGDCACPPGLPCQCGAQSKGHLVTRGAQKPSPTEVAGNRRAESARLRCFERTTSTASSPNGPT